MSNESTRNHLAQSLRSLLICTSRNAAVRKTVTFGLLLLLMVFSSACDDDNGSGSGASSRTGAAVKLVSEPVDLPPGQTEAQMAWEPSSGSIQNYLIFVSRNGAVFQFTSTSVDPEFDISGKGGDEVRIVVVAVSENGALSDSSPPSAPVRFHPAEQPATAVAAAQTTRESPSVAMAVAAQPGLGSLEAETPVNDADPIADADRVASSVDAATEEAQDTESGDSDAEDESRASMLENLLLADAQLSTRFAQSDEAGSWIQSFVDEELAAGVRLVGTGDLNGDDTRELIFQDSAGQLFLADGQAFLESTFTDGSGSNHENPDQNKPADTLKPGPRLSATERFVGLEDFGAESGAQWLIEDAITGRVKLADTDNGATETPVSHPTSSEDEDAATVLIGHGDFNGDGRMELLWRHNGEEDALFVAAAAAESGAFGSDAVPIPEIRRGDLPLAIADLNGDGRADLLSRDDEGRLRMTYFLNGEDTNVVQITEAFWAGGTEASTQGLEPVGTFDANRDGDAEIAWIDASGVQVWDAQNGPETLSDF